MAKDNFLLKMTDRQDRETILLNNEEVTDKHDRETILNIDQEEIAEKKGEEEVAGDEEEEEIAEKILTTNAKGTTVKKHACQRFLLTYATWIDKNNLKTFLWNIAGNNEGFVCYIAHESGKKDKVNPYKHTHVAVNFGKAIQVTTLAKFDYMQIHPNVSKIVTTKKASWQRCWKRACKYVCKEDKTVELEEEDTFQEVEKHSVVESIMDDSTVWDSLKQCSSFNHVLPIIAMHKHKPKEKPLPRTLKEEFYPWQFEILKMMEREPPKKGRNIWWLYDEMGKSGKTDLARYVYWEDPVRYYLTNKIGKPNDFIDCFRNSVPEPLKLKVFIINLAKSHVNKEHIYEILEDIDDGLLSAHKFSGENIYFNPLNIWVFCNEMPKPGKLTEDRLHIIELKDRRELIRRNIHYIPDKFLIQQKKEAELAARTLAFDF